MLIPGVGCSLAEGKNPSAEHGSQLIHSVLNNVSVFYQVL